MKIFFLANLKVLIKQCDVGFRLLKSLDVIHWLPLKERERERERERYIFLSSKKTSPRSVKHS